MLRPQRLNAVMSGLMGIVFGCSIVFLISRLVAANRRIMELEKHVTRKADGAVVTSLEDRVGQLETNTQQVLTSLSTQVRATLQSTQPPTPPLAPVQLSEEEQFSPLTDDFIETDDHVVSEDTIVEQPPSRRPVVPPPRVAPVMQPEVPADDAVDSDNAADEPVQDTAGVQPDEPADDNVKFQPDEPVRDILPPLPIMEE